MYVYIYIYIYIYIWILQGEVTCKSLLEVQRINSVTNPANSILANEVTLPIENLRKSGL